MWTRIEKLGCALQNIAPTSRGPCQRKKNFTQIEAINESSFPTLQEYHGILRLQMPSYS